MAFHLLRQNRLVHLITMFEKLLYDVIAKNIGHKLYTVWSNFSKYNVLLVGICSLQFLLDKPRSMLITAELDNMIIYVL